MDKKLIIVAIEYLEPEWMATKRAIEATKLPAHYCKRNPEGYGSLAEVINRGFAEAKAEDYEYAWIVTNITFEQDVPLRLIDA